MKNELFRLRKEFRVHSLERMAEAINTCCKDLPLVDSRFLSKLERMPIPPDSFVEAYKKAFVQIGNELTAAGR